MAEHAPTTTSTSRRPLAAALAAAAAAAFVRPASSAVVTVGRWPADLLPSADAELIGLCLRFDEIERRHTAVFAAHLSRRDEDAASLALAAMAVEHAPIVDRILTLSPTTLEGAIALAASVQAWSRGDFADNPSTDELLAKILIQGLARMSPSAGQLRFKHIVGSA